MAIDSAPMGLSLRPDDERPALAISGHVDESDVSRIVSALDHLTEQHDRCVSLDLGEVDSIDSAALDCLAERVLANSERPCRFHLSRINGQIRECLDQHPLNEFLCLEENCIDQTCHRPVQSCRIDVFSLPSDPVCCREARHRVRQVAREAGLQDSWISDMLLAVGEAVANAIRHGHSGRKDSSFTVSCLASSNKLSVSVSDHGPGFTLADTAPKKTSVYAETGRGIHCMHTLVDDVSFSFNGGTTVRLVKSYA